MLYNSVKTRPIDPNAKQEILYNLPEGTKAKMLYNSVKTRPIDPNVKQEILYNLPEGAKAKMLYNSVDFTDSALT